MTIDIAKSDINTNFWGKRVAHVLRFMLGLFGMVGFRINCHLCKIEKSRTPLQNNIEKSFRTRPDHHIDHEEEAKLKSKAMEYVLHWFKFMIIFSLQ